MSRKIVNPFAPSPQPITEAQVLQPATQKDNRKAKSSKIALHSTISTEPIQTPTPTIEILALPHTEPTNDSSDKELVPYIDKNGVQRLRKARKPHGKNNRLMRTPDSKIGYKRIHRINELALKGMPSNEIAEVFNISINTVNEITTKFRALLTDLDKVNDYREIRRDVLDGMHSRLLESALSPEKLAEANLRDTVWAAESIYKQSRLEAGLSTDNKAIRSFTTMNHPATKK